MHRCCYRIDSSGLRLFEVNTSASGAFIHGLLASAQKNCCSEMKRGVIAMRSEDFDRQALHVFTAQFRFQRSTGQLFRVASIDGQPEGEYLFPAFTPVQQLLSNHGIDAVIGDASASWCKAGRSTPGGWEIDLG